MLATVGSDAGEFATIEQLSDALRYYERPGRTEIIRGVYARAHAAPSLTHREEPAQDVAPPPPAPVRRRPLGKRWVAVGGAAAVCAAAIWLVVELRDDRTAGPDAPAESSIAADAWELIGELGRVVRDEARSGLAAIRTRVGSEPEPAVEEATSASATPARTDQPAAPTLSEASPNTASAAAAAGSTPLDTATSVPAPGGGRVVPQEGEVADAGGSEPADRIYSSNDIGVTPPVTVRPQMPVRPPPGVPADALGVVEVIVSDTGEVESVRLLSPPRTLHDRMMLSAMKTWLFQPAMKDGRAVRFRHLIQITLR